MPPQAALAVQAWNLMGGLDWAALDWVIALLGVDDVPRFIHALTAIRDGLHARRPT